MATQGWPSERKIVQVLAHVRLLSCHGRYDGDYDKTNLPGALLLTNYLTGRGDRSTA